MWSVNVGVVDDDMERRQEMREGEERRNTYGDS